MLSEGGGESCSAQDICGVRASSALNILLNCAALRYDGEPAGHPWFDPGIHIERARFVAGNKRKEILALNQIGQNSFLAILGTHPRRPTRASKSPNTMINKCQPCAL